jgi:hypothetical protein
MAVGASITFGTNSMTEKRVFSEAGGDVGVDDGTTINSPDKAYDRVTTNTNFGITLFANKYNELSEKWMWYYGAGLGFANSGSTVNAPKADATGKYALADIDGPSTTTISLGANLGALFFLNENWALNAGLNNLLALNYAMTNHEVVTPLTAGEAKQTTTGSNLNLTVGTGSFGLGAVNVGLFYFIR